MAVATVVVAGPSLLSFKQILIYVSVPDCLLCLRWPLVQWLVVTRSPFAASNPHIPTVRDRNFSHNNSRHCEYDAECSCGRESGTKTKCDVRHLPYNLPVYGWKPSSRIAGTAGAHYNSTLIPGGHAIADVHHLFLNNV